MKLNEKILVGLAEKRISKSNNDEIELALNFLKSYLEGRKIFRNADGTYDCNGSLTIRKNDPLLKKDKSGFVIPFNKIKNSFICEELELIGLVNCPQIVGKDFRCNNNNLTSLENGPKEVGEYYDCSFNKLVSLTGAPKVIPYIFNCDFNELTNLKGGPQKVNDFYLDDNKLTSLDGIPKEIEGNLIIARNPIVKKLGKTKEEVKNKIIKKYGIKLNYVGISPDD